MAGSFSLNASTLNSSGAVTLGVLRAPSPLVRGTRTPAGTTIYAGTLVVGNNSALGAGGPLAIRRQWPLEPGHLCGSSRLVVRGNITSGAGSSLTINQTSNQTYTGAISGKPCPDDDGHELARPGGSKFLRRLHGRHATSAAARWKWT